jgi:hypothetical protein
MTSFRKYIALNLFSYVFDTLFFTIFFVKVLGGKGVWFDAIAFLFFFCWAGYELVARTRVFYLNIHSYLFGTLFLLGVFSIEYSDGFFMYEISDLSGWKDTFFGALACMYAYVRATSAVLRNVAENNSTMVAKRVTWFYFLVGAYLLVSLIVIFHYKPALVLQVDRFIYDKVILGVWGNFTNLGYYFCLGLGIVFFWRNSYFAFLMFLLVIVVFLLKGHKFSNLIEAMFLFVVPYFCKASLRALRRKVLFVFFGVSLFFGMAVSINLYLFPSFSVNDYLRHRLFQEGQLWWAVAKDPENERLHLKELKVEVSSYFSSELMADNFLDIGMYKVMRLAAPSDLVEQKIERQSRYTRSTQALLYYYFNGFIAFLVMFIFGLLWGWLLRQMYFASMGFRLLESVLLCRVFYIFMKAFKDADIYKIFSLEMLVLICAILFLSKVKINIPRLTLFSPRRGVNC